MKTTRFQSSTYAGPQAGFSTLMVMILIGATAVILGATMSRTYTSAKLNDRYSYFTVCNSAAESATEKVMARMIADIEQNGEAQVIANISSYQTNIPSTNESTFWNNFIFSDVNGHSNQITVSCIDTNANTALTPLQSQYPGLNGFCATYAIVANVTPVNANYNFTSAVEQTVQLAEIPVFQFAIFYNSLLEFTTAGTLIVQGRVHANSNIYVGSANPLTFNYTVTSTGVITNPPWAGTASQSSYTGSITYNGNPKTGTGSPTLILPIGSTNNSPTNVIQILYPASGSDTLAMTQQRYWNKAEMLILVTNTTYVPSNNIVVIRLRTPPLNGMSYQDSTPMFFTNINPLTGVTNAAWASNNFDCWLSTTNSFYDFRQAQYMRTTQINVSNFYTWCNTNPCIYTNIGNTNKFSPATPLNIVYVGDWRTTNSTTNSAVRMIGGGSAKFPTNGLTVATFNPLYVMGNYNTPLGTTNYNSTNVTGTYPASFVCDALTILSASWLDSYSSSGSASARPATSTTINAAMITGVVYSTGPGGDGTTQFSGGVHNMPRMLENWGNGSTLTLNTSMVNLFPSAIATKPFIWPADNTVYGVPTTRQFYFNQNYNTAAGLPPGTPLIYELIRADWSVVPPRTIVTNFQIFDIATAYAPQ